ncbi:hypothetical protein LCGC14_2054320 [marine sediment metagenome]|uniref:Uncharacterized protein n=1 Tax=marine sediment metagenome TaxID=412755 RepID=A0A0F9HK25_9ZZZZ
MTLQRVGVTDHARLTGVEATDHHTATVAGDINLADLAEKLHASLATVTTSQHHVKAVSGDMSLADLAERLHASLTSVGVDDHHNEGHTILSHSDGADACKIASGTYSGDGETSQAITGIGFTVLFVMIFWPITTETQVVNMGLIFTTNLFVDDNAAGFVINLDDSGGNANTKINGIIATGADGFTVDDAAADRHPNTNAATYTFIAFGIEA